MTKAEKQASVYQIQKDQKFKILQEIWIPHSIIEYNNIWFNITFYRPNLESESYQNRVLNRTHDSDVGKNVGKDVGENVGKKYRKSKILTKIKNNQSFTYKSLAKDFNVSQKTVERDIKELKKEGLIKYRGSKRSGNWIIIG
ncbi:MAG TPA: HTH domain-containing protein [bacterium]|nr:HTH domain-containing protein [bacterium]